MKTRAYSIYDKKSQIYGKPFYFFKDGEALRAFRGSVQNEKESQLSEFPEDFELFYTGTFDQQKGVFEVLEHPQYIGKALDHVKPKTPLPLVGGGQGRPPIMESDVKTNSVK